MTLDRRLLIPLLAAGALLFIVSGAIAGVLIAESGDGGDKKDTGKGYLGVRVAAAQGGLRVVSLDGDGPAAKAGIRAGDVIRAVDGQVVRTPQALRRVVEAKEPGERVTLTYERGERELQAVVELGEAPADAKIGATPAAGLPEGLAPQLRELLQRQLDRGDVDPEELLRLLQRNASENVRLGKLVEANATSLKLAPLDGGDQVTLTLTPSTIIRRAGAAIKVSGLAPGEIVLVLSMDGGRTAFAVYAYGLP